MPVNNDLEVSFFAESHQYPVWVSVILEALSNGCWMVPKILTLSSIEESFTEQVQESMDNKRIVLSDPDCAAYKWMSKEDPDEHPWGEDTIKICRWFLDTKTGAKDILEIVTRIRQAGEQAVSKNLPELVLGEGAENIAEATERMFGFIIQTLRNEAKQELK